MEAPAMVTAPQSDWGVSTEAARLHRQAIVWDMHGCMPLRPDADLGEIARYARAGASFISLNVGFDLVPWSEAVKIAAHFRAWVLAHPERYLLADTAADVRRAKREGKLAVAFDLEGARALDGQISMIAAFYRLGVRSMLLAYNAHNEFSAGCTGADTGLTPLGRQAIAEMNRVGMIVDCSHMGCRSTMEVLEISAAPVVFSHSNPSALNRHHRNIGDGQIRACAATGGVIGINGVGRFLGDPETRSETIARHVDYVAQLVGAAHVGLGLDCVFDLDELDAFHKNHPGSFPEGSAWTRDQARFAQPEQLPEITENLLRLGYSEADIGGILGGNFLRVAEQVWT